jgi:hypothetical protein
MRISPDGYRLSPTLLDFTLFDEGVIGVTFIPNATILAPHRLAYSNNSRVYP